MNPNEHRNGANLGARLAAEARANRPAFNAELHARVMAALPATTETIAWSAPRRSQFNLLRTAALLAVAVGCGVVTMSLMKESPVPSSLATAPALPKKLVAAKPEEAERSRRLLALARVRPMKMLNQLLGSPAQKPRQPEEEAHQAKAMEDPSVAAAELISIRVLSRAPFLDMQFKPQAQTHNGAPGN